MRLTIRKATEGLRHCVLGGGVALAVSLLCCTPAQAKPVAVTIDNKLERTQEYDPSGWIYSDLVSQSYELKWDYTFSPRLKAGTLFKLTLEDTLKSQDIDTKTVTPSWETSLTGLVWDFKLTLKDSIMLSNEFNTPQHDTIEAGVDFNLLPAYFPPLKSVFRVIQDYQGGIVDTLDKKFELSTSYTFTLLTLDGSWKQGQSEDLLKVDSDTDTTTWDFNLSYNQLVMPSLRIAYTNALKGDRTETFDHDTGILATAPTLSHSVSNKLKLEVQAFPAVTSFIEVGREHLVPTEETKDSLTFETTATQEALSLGTASESIKYARTDDVGPAVDTAEAKWTYTAELAGSPYVYVDYSVKYTLEQTDKESLVAADDSSERSEKIDISTTITPTPPLTLDLAYNQEMAEENGARSAETSIFKAKSTFKGEYLNIPNLTFTPTASINRERSFFEDTFLRTEDIKLEFKYLLDLPTPFKVELGPSYGWTRSDGVTTDNYYSLTYTFEAKTKAGGWGLNASLSGEYKNILGPVDGDGEWTLAQDAEASISRKLTRTIGYKMLYRYKIPADETAYDSDSAELGLRWDYLRMNAEVTATRDRTFGPDKVDTRKYTAKFGMMF